MFGSILSWGIMWPLISEQEGNWCAAGVVWRGCMHATAAAAVGRCTRMFWCPDCRYPAGLSSTSFSGLYGYKAS